MADPILVALLLLVVTMLAVILVLVARRGRAIGAEADDISKAFQASGLYQQLGRVERMAQEMANSGTELRNLFRLRPEVGAIGEFQLEAILGDLLPPNRFVIRRNMANIGTPDAGVRTKDGWLLIDSKFPIEAYRHTVATEPDGEASRRRFANVVRGHVDAIAGKYVRPEAGTLPFAVAFLPTEAIFARAIDSDPRILRDAYRRGVLIASPSTLASHLAILSAGIRADEVGRAAVHIQTALRSLERRIGELRSEWDTLSRHVLNAHGKLPDVARRLESFEVALRAAARPDGEAAASD